MGKNNKLSTQGEVSSANKSKSEEMLAAVYRESPFDRPRDIRWSAIGMLLLAACIGAGAAIIVLFALITGSIKGVPVLDRLDITALFSPSAPITIARTERVTVTTEERTADVLKRVTPSLFGIYAGNTLSEDEEGLLKSAENPLAHATALTSDGWLLTAGALNEKEAGSLVAVAFDGKMFPVLQRIQDSATGLWLLKVDAATLVSAALRRNASASVPGTPVIVTAFRVGNNPLVLNVSVMGVVTLPYRDADKLESRIRLSSPVTGVGVGSPVVTMDAEVAGIVSAIEGGATFAVPIASISGVLDQAFKNGEILRPVTGIRYVELSNVADLAFPLTRGRRQGALLIAHRKIIPVAAGSSAEEAGLEEGDIIVKVEGELVREETDLAALLQSYPSSEQVKLTVLREGEERFIDIALSPPDSNSQKK